MIAEKAKMKIKKLHTSSKQYATLKSTFEKFHPPFIKGEREAGNHLHIQLMYSVVMYT